MFNVFVDGQCEYKITNNKTVSLIRCLYEGVAFQLPTYAISPAGKKYRITCINESAFKRSSIKHLCFENNSFIKEIKDNAFALSSLETVELPKKLKLLNHLSTFKHYDKGCVSISCKKGSKCFIDNEGDIYQMHPFVIVQGSFHKSRFIIRESVKRIYSLAFFYHPKITSIHFPSSLEVIDSNSFTFSPTLTRISFAEPSKLKIIGESAFSYASIKSIRFPASLEILQSEAFAETVSIESIVFPADSKLKSIGKSCFSRIKLKHIDFPASLEEIHDCAFYFCINLQEISFPTDSALNYLSYNTFQHCSSLNSIKYPENLEYVLKLDYKICETLK